MKGNYRAPGAPDRRKPNKGIRRSGLKPAQTRHTPSNPIGNVNTAPRRRRPDRRTQRGWTPSAPWGGLYGAVRRTAYGNDNIQRRWNGSN